MRVTRPLVALSGQHVSGQTATNPSGVPAPVGNLTDWHQIYIDQFKQAAPLGSFGGCQWRASLARSVCPRLPRTDRSQLVAYSDGLTDTHGTGKYEASKVLSIQNGTLDFWLHSVNGTPAGAVVAPKIPSSSADHVGREYGAYAIRFRASSAEDYHLVIMLWADAYSSGAQWPTDGEVDFPEGNLNQGMNGYLHFSGPSGPAQYAFNRLGSFTRWHTAVIEWTPDAVQYILDGRVVATIKKHVPQTPMHLLIQAETSTTAPPADVQAHVQVAWIAAYAPAG